MFILSLVGLHKMYPDRDPYSPHCQTQLNTYFHMFWECPKVQVFWSAVFELFNLRLDLSVPMSPEMALFRIPGDAQRSHHSKLFIS